MGLCLYKGMAATMPALGPTRPEVSESLSLLTTERAVDTLARVRDGRAHDPLENLTHELKIIDPVNKEECEGDLVVYFGYGSGPNTDSGRSYIEGLLSEKELENWRIITIDSFVEIPNSRLNDLIASHYRALQNEGFQVRAAAGNSYGGMLATIFAMHSVAAQNAAQGKAVEKLVMVGTPGIGGQLLNHLASNIGDFTGAIKDYGSSCYASGKENKSKEDIQGSRPAFTDPHKAWASVQHLGRLLRYNLSNFVSNLDGVKTFASAGTNDGFVPYGQHEAAIKKMNELSPGQATLNLFEGKTHTGLMKREGLANFISQALKKDSTPQPLLILDSVA